MVETIRYVYLSLRKKAVQNRSGGRTKFRHIYDFWVFWLEMFNRHTLSGVNATMIAQKKSQTWWKIYNCGGHSTINQKYAAFWWFPIRILKFYLLEWLILFSLEAAKWNRLRACLGYVQSGRASIYIKEYCLSCFKVFNVSSKHFCPHQNMFFWMC